MKTKKRVGVAVFPGSNCDHDIIHFYSTLMGAQTIPLWHKDSVLPEVDLVVIPGGFSYGDYLRTGALAKLSPIMSEIVRHAKAGRPVLGICNGFQILCEAGLLPGALIQNIGMKFLSRFVHVRVEKSSSAFTRDVEEGTVVTCPIAHFEGNYFAASDTIQNLQDHGQILLKYCNAQGQVNDSDRENNPNGSLSSIAGISNREGNVFGLMPHPERSSELVVGGEGKETGRALLEKVLS